MRKDARNIPCKNVIVWTILHSDPDGKKTRLPWKTQRPPWRHSRVAPSPSTFVNIPRTLLSRGLYTACHCAPLNVWYICIISFIAVKKHNRWIKGYFFLRLVKNGPENCSLGVFTFSRLQCTEKKCIFNLHSLRIIGITSSPRTAGQWQCISFFCYISKFK